jgi:hypothetical protein
MSEDDHPEWWEREVDAVRATVVGHCQRTGVDPAEIALPAASVRLGIGVEDLDPTPRTGHTDAIGIPWHGCEIDGNEQDVTAQ